MRRLIGSLIGVVFTVALAAGPVAAAAPDRAVFIQVTDQEFGTCPDGSVINAHFEFRTIRWFFPDRVEFQVNTDQRFTDSVTGLYLQAHGAYHSVLYFDPTSDSGISGAADSGDFGQLVIPGSGVVYHIAGRIVYNANFDPVIQTGVDSGAGVDLCQALGTP